ncbi:hypothetical protein MUK42_07162 [Musa troglodytarum]|uniref:Uncharacterized protein n=1 Tax=Musa troglodytarum TaxID=320322 RepID=A0A9E7L2M7_9LILI|nr:hypothetical protein MUK42_07162 [Musa troglodytarum]
MALRWRLLLFTVLVVCVLVDQAHFRKAVVEDEPVMRRGWKACSCDRLRRAVRGEMQPALEAECVHAGVRDVLQQVQVRAAGHLRQPGDVWRLLHQHDHPRQSHQVPLVADPPPPRVSCAARNPVSRRLLLFASASVSVYASM